MAMRWLAGRSNRGSRINRGERGCGDSPGCALEHCAGLGVGGGKGAGDDVDNSGKLWPVVVPMVMTDAPGREVQHLVPVLQACGDEQRLRDLGCVLIPQAGSELQTLAEQCSRPL